MRKIHGGDIYAFDKKMIDFSANINPLGISKKVISDIKENIFQIVNYPDIECKKLRAAISQKEKVNENFIVCGNGAGELIFNIVSAILPKKVLIISPTFAEYENACNTIFAEKIYYKLSEQNQFDVLSDILDYINKDIDMIFICNPNNPTGRIIEKNLIIDIIKKAKDNNCFDVVDECFLDFVNGFEKYSVVDFTSTYENLFVLKAFTKMYAMG